jgi:multiple sugar transport system permease protein
MHLRRLWEIGFGLLAGGVTLLFAFPLVWLVIGALWPDHQPLAAIWWMPAQFRPMPVNFVTAWQSVPMARFLTNSLFVVLLAVPLTVLVATAAAFAMTQLPARWQSLLVWLSLAALLAPRQALWLARFPLFKALGWVDSPWPLIAPALIGGSPFFVLLLYSAFRRLPVELFEAAVLDGASTAQLWRLIGVPLVRGAMMAVALLTFLHTWGDFADALLYLRSTAHMTLPVGLRLLTQLDATRWPVMLAGATILTAPSVLVYLWGQRFLQLPVWLR